jgi:hypothetical protein
VSPSTLLDDLTVSGPIEQDFLDWAAENNDRNVNVDIDIQDLGNFYNKPNLQVGTGEGAGDFAIRCNFVRSQLSYLEKSNNLAIPIWPPPI